MIDTNTGISYKFRDIKPVTRKIASALTRLGFKQGDVLFYVAYDAALIYLVNIGVWLCGGAIRGCYQKDRQEMYTIRMREVSARFVLCDLETAAVVKSAADQLEWDVTFLSIGGEVEGVLSIEELIKNEDCSVFPEEVKVNSKEDTLIILNTSGSTGSPKGVIHTHYNTVAYFLNKGMLKKLESATSPSWMATFGNYFSSLIYMSLGCIFQGASLHNVSKFEIKLFVESLLKHKPQIVLLYPYALHTFLQSAEIDENDFSFIKSISLLGSALYYSTAKTLEDKLPHVKLATSYGVTEALSVATTKFTPPPVIRDAENEGIVAGIKYKKYQGELHLTSGILAPREKAKIVDPSTGLSLGRNEKGELLIKSSCFMKGYLRGNKETDVSTGIDENGWFATGDLAFFDEDGWLYVVGRSRFTFKYNERWVSPSDIEAIILSHPAVVSAVVVGVPNLQTTSSAKAFVVLKPGSEVTEEEIKMHVAGQTEIHKHLHGGVEFLDSMPKTPSGKLDRSALQKRAKKIGN
ncbi:4-coumarate--CoA ligase 1-like isoform X2 [Ischnura elegans]|uniref:4-coumarate--CoA ligase 1-like isoform X2 n=1 Tax=Ischnura elegans TaxID=197161 RepID=UPI001ED8A105|nr:4-coumarate--CoA ligase 1-like isoform X2 [Ischnura elegans]